MHKRPDDQNRLLPLKYFSNLGTYKLNYLSILVQRKKLKAKKIGRNYYSTKQWFVDYIEKHAQEEKKRLYEAMNVEIVPIVNAISELNPAKKHKELGFIKIFKYLKKAAISKIVAFFM